MMMSEEITILLVRFDSIVSKFENELSKMESFPESMNYDR